MSNRIEGITVLPERLSQLVVHKTTPRDRPEQEVAGYREVLADIHQHHASLRLSTKLILDWHQARHDLRPWWEYFLGMLTAPYNEFEARVGTITSARGAKRQMVRRAIDRLPDPFTIADLRRACAGVSDPTLKRALADMSKEGKIKRIGTGPTAQWGNSGGNSGDVYEQAVVKAVAGFFSREFQTSIRHHPVWGAKRLSTNRLQPP